MIPPPVRGQIARFVGGRALNTFGRAVITTTVLWELYARTHDKLLLSAVGAMQIIPVVAMFVPAGALVDRFDRRKIAMVSVLGTGVVGGGLALASALRAPIAVYLVLLLLQGLVTSIHAPATSSWLANLPPRAYLPAANRILSSVSETAQITAPGLVGLALVVVAPHWVYAVVPVTAAIASSLYRALPASPPPARTPTAEDADWRVGVRYIVKTPLLVSALTLDMFAILFAGVVALLPSIATDVLHAGPIAYGVLRAAQPAGAVAMALVGGRLPAWRRPGVVLLVVVILYGVATIGIGLSEHVVLTGLCLFACGALDNISVVIRLTLEQLVVPDAIRGRVAAVHNVFTGISNELGAAESGLAAKLFGTVPAIVGGGAIAIAVVGVVALAWPQLARMPPLARLSPEDR